MKGTSVRRHPDRHYCDRRDRGFKSVSVVIPVINEVKSLHDTVNTIFSCAAESILEVIIVVCDKTTAESRSACRDLAKQYDGQISIIPQILPFLGGALREGLQVARGSHVILMFSDGESEPRSVADLIREAKNNPEDVIVASRWIEKNSFQNYPFLKTLLNYFFQKTFSFLYLKKITDFTFGYRLYPTPLMQTIDWQETGHSFVFESIVKPLRLGVGIREIPTTWKARSEGESQLRIYMYFRYLWVGFKWRFLPRRLFYNEHGNASGSSSTGG